MVSKSSSVMLPELLQLFYIMYTYWDIRFEAIMLSCIVYDMSSISTI